MARQFHRITPIALFIFALMFVGKFSAHSDSSAQRTHRPVFDASYRSGSSNHKVIVQANEPDIRDAILAGGGSIMQGYGALVLTRAPRPAGQLVGSHSGYG